MKNPDQMRVMLPALASSDILDMLRVLQAITEAFEAHHREQLLQHCRSEQPDLFDSIDEDIAPF